jgi:hypothetical protein
MRILALCFLPIQLIPEREYFESMLPSKTPKLHPGVIWETEGPHASTSNVSTSMCASNATAGIQMVIALSQAMPRKRKGPKILVGYKHKKGTGHSKWEGCHEIVEVQKCS